MHSENYGKSHQNNQVFSDNQGKLTGLEAFQKVLELTRPVNGSTEIWLKLDHNQFVVGNYTPDGHFPIWETKLTNRDDTKSRVRTIQNPDCWEYVSQICNSIELPEGLKFSTPLTYKQASYILEITRHWDFTPDRGQPRCLSKLRSASLRQRRSLISSVVAEGGER